MSGFDDEEYESFELDGAGKSADSASEPADTEDEPDDDLEDDEDFDEVDLEDAADDEIDFVLAAYREDGQPYVLEVNPCPDLSSNAGLARMGRAFGWSYDDLVMQIVDEALMRSQSHSAAAALVSGVSAA